MEIRREAGHAPRTEALASQLCADTSPCIGCRNCAGLCDALFDLFVLPGLVLRDTRA